jgi:predicted DNA-binding transcriptional regulator YafY
MMIGKTRRAAALYAVLEKSRQCLLASELAAKAGVTERQAARWLRDQQATGVVLSYTYYELNPELRPATTTRAGRR